MAAMGRACIVRRVRRTISDQEDDMITTTRRTDLADLLAEGHQFQNAGRTLRAHGFSGYGRLSTTEQAILVEDTPRYFVYSYATPIAWQRANGTWYVTDTKYSPTTAQHVAQVRRAVANLV
jgi:hypothetical protein